MILRALLVLVVLAWLPGCTIQLMERQLQRVDGHYMVVQRPYGSNEPWQITINMPPEVGLSEALAIYEGRYQEVYGTGVGMPSPFGGPRGGPMMADMRRPPGGPMGGPHPGGGPGVVMRGPHPGGGRPPPGGPHR